MLLLVGGVLSFLIGSIPFGYIIAKTQGLKIQEHGSGNTGATNVARSVGKKWGLVTLILDALKGAFVVYSLASLLGLSHTYAILFGVFAILGHCYSPFLKFKGGKGVATTLGVLIVALPELLPLGIIVFFSVFFLTKLVSLCSISAISAILLISLIDFSQGQMIALECFSIFFIWLLTCYRHWSNIDRILSDTEPKWS